MAVVSFCASGEPTLTLPYITLSPRLHDDSHPPVKTNKNCKTDTPLDADPGQVNPTEQDKPQATMLALDIR